MKKDSEYMEDIIKYNNTVIKRGQKANKDLGMTKEYNAKNRAELWDSEKAKHDYKDKEFGDKKTYRDEISGEILHKSQKAAQNKYHMKNSDGENVSKEWAKHSAEVDHVNALKDTHDKVKNNPFITDDDFKRIMNKDENFRLLSKQYNTSKGDKSDWDIVLSKDKNLGISRRTKVASQKIKSDAMLGKEFTKTTVKNMGSEFKSGATDTLLGNVIPLTAMTIENMCEVANGEKSVEDMAKDMGKTTVKVAVDGGMHKIIKDIAEANIKNSSNKLISGIAKSNAFTQIVALSRLVGESAVRYVNGEIDESEFIEEVGEKGTVMVAGMIGGAVGREIGLMIGGTLGTAVLPGGGSVLGREAGAIIGEILGTMITTVTCGLILSIKDVFSSLDDYKIDDYKIKENYIKKLEREALAEMETQREKFRGIVEREGKRWDEEIGEGFNMILNSVCERNFNAQGFTDGLDRILNLFGKSVAFKTLDEYERQLDTTLKLTF